MKRIGGFCELVISNIENDSYETSFYLYINRGEFARLMSAFVSAEFQHADRLPKRKLRKDQSGAIAFAELSSRLDENTGKFVIDPRGQSVDIDKFPELFEHVSSPSKLRNFLFSSEMGLLVHAIEGPWVFLYLSFLDADQTSVDSFVEEYQRSKSANVFLNFLRNKYPLDAQIFSDFNALAGELLGR